MTDRNERLKSIRERLSAATPGPWRWLNDDALVADYGRRRVVLCGDSIARLQTCGADGILKPQLSSDPHAELIANAPSDIAYLLALVERYEKALEFYADLKNWRTVTVSNKNQRFCIMTGADLEYFQEPNQDSYCGKRAREALEAGERE